MKEKYGKDDVFYHMFGIPEKAAKFLDIKDLHYKKFYELFYIISACKNSDQHASLFAEEYSGMNYGAITYIKAARIFNYLISYLCSL